MEKLKKFEEILPLLHNVGEYLIKAYPNQPDSLTTIAGITFKFIFLNNQVVQISEVDKDGNVITLLFDK